MLVLGPQKLVVLEVPKTASLAIRAMLDPLRMQVFEEAPRHTGIGAFQRDYAGPLAAMLGGPVQTVAVVRPPLARMQSWYRYRLRDQVVASHVSTVEIGFDAFMQAYLSSDPPPFARIGRQDRFVGWDGTRAAVDHVFDYEDLRHLARFLRRRTGEALQLPSRNRSKDIDGVDYTLGDETLGRYRKKHAAEFALYEAVKARATLGV